MVARQGEREAWWDLVLENPREVLQVTILVLEEHMALFPVMATTNIICVEKDMSFPSALNQHH